MVAGNRAAKEFADVSFRFSFFFESSRIRVVGCQLVENQKEKAKAAARFWTPRDPSRFPVREHQEFKFLCNVFMISRSGERLGGSFPLKYYRYRERTEMVA